MKIKYTTMNEEQIIDGDNLIAGFMELTYGKIWHPKDSPEIGYEWTCGDNLDSAAMHPLYRFAHCSKYLYFNTSFDWLMPVVEKIESLNDDIVNKVYVNISERKCAMWTYFDVTEVLREDVGDGGMSDMLKNEVGGKFKVRISSKVSKIDAVYRAVVQFITWYNNQKKYATHETEAKGKRAS